MFHIYGLVGIGSTAHCVGSKLVLMSRFNAAGYLRLIQTYKVKVRIHRGSYMSVHVLLILLNELGKRDKMRGLPSILSLFRNKFNKFNNTRSRMLDSIYHMTNTSSVKALYFCHYDRNVVITFP